MDVVPASLPSVGDNASDDQFEVSTRLNDPQAAKEPSEVGSEQFQILALDGGAPKPFLPRMYSPGWNRTLESKSRTHSI